MSPEDRIARAHAEDAARALANAAPVVEELQHAPIIETRPSETLVNEEPPASYVDPGAPVVELIPEEKMNEQKQDAARNSTHEEDIKASQTGEIIGKIDGIKLDVTEPESAEVVANKVEQLVGDSGTEEPVDPEPTKIPLFVADQSVPCGDFVAVWTAVRNALYLPSLYETEADLPIPAELVASLIAQGVNPEFLAAFEWREALNEIEVRVRENGWAGAIILLYAAEDKRVVEMPELFQELATAQGKRFRMYADIPKAPSECCDKATEGDDGAIPKSATAPAPFFPADDEPPAAPAPAAPPIIAPPAEGATDQPKAPEVKVVKRKVVENTDQSRYAKHSQGPGKRK